jgi:thiosulfate reductase cytochrome b subunit
MVESPKENPVHYPPDRRFRVWVRPAFLLLFVAVATLPSVVAWAQFLTVGLPASPFGPSIAVEEIAAPSGFPAWVRLTHYVNFLFLVLLARSGLSILMDHPRLYWNDHCTPGTEWKRFTPLEFPSDRVWTAKDDARYISPWFALPGYRHTIGTARHWHLLSALFWFLNGFAFVALLFGTDQWQRIVPTSWQIIPDAWAVFVHYTTFHMPVELDPFYHHNALQQLSYFAVVFVMAPLSFMTGLAMSPSIDSRFPWFPKVFGGRQPARSIHFLLLLGYVAFLVVHVTMVAATGLVRNMNYIVLGSNDGNLNGLLLGLLGIGMVMAVCYLAHWAAWKHPRAMQYLVRYIHAIMRLLLFRHLAPRAQFSKKDISPFLWPNGKPPATEEWESLAAGDFKEFRLRVYGLVESPAELSLDEMKALGKQEQVTMHHCIQGWSGIAQWGGLPLAKLIELVRPTSEAKVVVFHSFGEGLYGGEYYDTQPLEIALHTQCILAYEMNYQPLGPLYGSPLRLRVENQLGYKMVKWIKAIEFVASEKQIGKGHGGKNEDDEYFDLVPDI